MVWAMGGIMGGERKRNKMDEKEKGVSPPPLGSPHLTIVEVSDVELDLVRVLVAPPPPASSSAIAVILVIVVADAAAAAAVAVGRWGHDVVAPPPAATTTASYGAFGGARAGTGTGSGTAVFGHCLEFDIYLFIGG